MVASLEARRLEKEVDYVIATSLDKGLDGLVSVTFAGYEERLYKIDVILTDEVNDAVEIWLTAPGRRTFWDRIFGFDKRELLRVSRVRGEVRRNMTSVRLDRAHRLRHLFYLEEIGAPRQGGGVLRYHQPQVEAQGWLRAMHHSLAQAS
jgi:hypothetical protein